MKFFFFSLLLFLSLNSNAQITKIDEPKRTEVGSFKNGATQGATLSYSVDNDDTLYTIVYSDATYQRIVSIKSFSFIETGGALESLYQTLKEAIKAKKGTEASFKVGDDKITIVTDKEMGFPYVYVHVKDKGFFTLMAKQLDKLFGKR